MTGSIKDLEGVNLQRVVDDRPPLKSPKTVEVAAALAFGFRLAPLPSKLGKEHTAAFLDATEELPEGRLKREVTWCFDGDAKVQVMPIAAGQEFTLEEFWALLRDDAWLDANPHHPIAMQARLLREYEALRHKLSSKKFHPDFGEPLLRHMKVRKGKKSVYIREDSTEKERAELLKQL
ncbi:MAG: hypothetical protein QM496_01930 [Verrucomicrobiota bacterium]